MGEEIGQKGESWGRQKNENGAIVIESKITRQSTVGCLTYLMQKGQVVKENIKTGLSAMSPSTRALMATLS